MLNSKARCAALMVVTLSLAGCMTTEQTLVQQGYPLAYAQGFDDGCHSGRKAGGNMFEAFKKDVARFTTEQQYASGWSDGFRQCESELENALRQQRMYEQQQHLQALREKNQLSEQHALEREVLKGVDTQALKNLK